MQIKEMMDQIQRYQGILGYSFEYTSAEAQMDHIRQLALAQHAEVTEFLDWLPFKPWRRIEDQPFNIKEASLELVDQFFFLTNMWLALGLDTADFEVLFKHKLAENIDRVKRGYNKPSEQMELELDEKGETP